MFKVKKNDIFEKNMSSSELYQTWVTTKEEKQLQIKIQKEFKLFDRWMNELITKNGTTKY
jgi:hypothetical protein